MFEKIRYGWHASWYITHIELLQRAVESGDKGLLKRHSKKVLKHGRKATELSRAVKGISDETRERNRRCLDGLEMLYPLLEEGDEADEFLRQICYQTLYQSLKEDGP